MKVRHNARLPLEALAPYCYSPPPATIHETEPQPISWTDVFGNGHPVEIEVGSGKGLFLVTSAQTRPEVNFLGIEVVRALQLYVATRLAKRDLHNARMACTDARWFFRARVSAASLQAVHVYFPDPWWKARHKKRRVFTPEFAASVAKALVPGGRLFIATDVEEYFGVMTGLVAELPALRELERSIEDGPPRSDEVLANFERKARQKGGKVWRASYAKV